MGLNAESMWNTSLIEEVIKANKEKMIQIYEALANLTLHALNDAENKITKSSYVLLSEDVLDMIRATQSIYETISKDCLFEFLQRIGASMYK